VSAGKICLPGELKAIGAQGEYLVSYTALGLPKSSSREISSTLASFRRVEMLGLLFPLSISLMLD
jgi:hypothetical protein